MSAESDKLWGGRFSKGVDFLLERLNSSISVDKRLYKQDIAGSQAYAKALEGAHMLTHEETVAICNGLDKVKEEWATTNFIIKQEDEDIHTANERRLKELIGDPATKLHVGRSRNDQVITDMKLWLKAANNDLAATLKLLIKTIAERAENEVDVLMPGYTHLQRAQPVRWSHWLLSHAWTLKNDADRLKDALRRVDVMPLGSGAIAGNPFSIDRENLADNLGFAEVTQNSMQAISDRDFVAEFLFWSSLVGIHLSRLAEDLIIYSTSEFGFVTIDETFSTGSSLMPQKRNPDSLELIRGVGAAIYGECCSFMMTLKGLPSTYNKDLQGDKEAMFKSYDKLWLILNVAIGTIKTLKLNSDKCKNGLSFDMLATDLAYYLVRRGVPFRKAHELVGKVVAKSEQKGVSIEKLPLSELKEISENFEEDVVRVWNYENSVEQYKVTGGTCKGSVLRQIEMLTSWLN